MLRNALFVGTSVAVLTLCGQAMAQTAAPYYEQQNSASHAGSGTPGVNKTLPNREDETGTIPPTQSMPGSAPGMDEQQGSDSHAGTGTPGVDR